MLIIIIIIMQLLLHWDSLVEYNFSIAAIETASEQLNVPSLLSCLDDYCDLEVYKTPLLNSKPFLLWGQGCDI